MRKGRKVGEESEKGEQRGREGGRGMKGGDKN